MRRAAGDVEVDRQRSPSAPLCTSGWSTIRPAGDRAGADGDHDLRARAPRRRSSRSASCMFSVTGPVISRPSAWRGEATNWMPKRPRSKTTVPSTLTSASQALQPPALTWRSLSERPKSRRVFVVERRARAAAARRRDHDQVVARRAPPGGSRCVNAIAPARDRPSAHRCRRGSGRGRARSARRRRAIASVGHASAQARQPSAHFAASSTGRPRKRSGSVGRVRPGSAIVRCP